MDTIQTHEQTTSGPTNKQTGGPKNVFVFLFSKVSQKCSDSRENNSFINRQILMETFHKLERIWLQRLWVALPTIYVIASHMCLVNCVCSVLNVRPSNMICLSAGFNWDDNFLETLSACFRTKTDWSYWKTFALIYNCNFAYLFLNVINSNMHHLRRYVKLSEMLLQNRRHWICQSRSF